MNDNKKDKNAEYQKERQQRINKLKKDIKSIYIYSVITTILFYIEIAIIFFFIIFVIIANLNNLTTNYNETITVLTTIFVTIESVRLLLLFILLCMIFASKNEKIKQELLAWAIVSLIPAIAFITFFFLKRKIKKMYHKSHLF